MEKSSYHFTYSLFLQATHSPSKFFYSDQVLGQLLKIVGRSRNREQEKGRGLGDAEEQAEVSTRAEIKQELKKAKTIVVFFVHL